MMPRPHPQPTMHPAILHTAWVWGAPPAGSMADPSLCCTTSEFSGFFLADCFFVQKAYYGQLAGAQAVLVTDHTDVRSLLWVGLWRAALWRAVLWWGSAVGSAVRLCCGLQAAKAWCYMHVLVCAPHGAGFASSTSEAVGCRSKAARPPTLCAGGSAHHGGARGPAGSGGPGAQNLHLSGAGHKGERLLCRASFLGNELTSSWARVSWTSKPVPRCPSQWCWPSTQGH